MSTNVILQDPDHDDNQKNRAIRADGRGARKLRPRQPEHRPRLIPRPSEATPSAGLPRRAPTPSADSGTNDEDATTSRRRALLAKARAAAERAAAERKQTGEKRVRLDPIERLKRNPTSRALAINAYCFGCSGRNADPCVRWRVGNCPITDCELYQARPYKHLCGSPTPRALL